MKLCITKESSNRPDCSRPHSAQLRGQAPTATARTGGGRALLERGARGRQRGARTAAETSSARIHESIEHFFRSEPVSTVPVRDRARPPGHSTGSPRGADFEGGGGAFGRGPRDGGPPSSSR